MRRVGGEDVGLRIGLDGTEAEHGRSFRCRFGLGFGLGFECRTVVGIGLRFGVLAGAAAATLVALGRGRGAADLGDQIGDGEDAVGVVACGRVGLTRGGVLVGLARP
jgi:hypothetical protein